MQGVGSTISPPFWNLCRDYRISKFKLATNNQNSEDHFFAGKSSKNYAFRGEKPSNILLYYLSSISWFGTLFKNCIFPRKKNVVLTCGFFANSGEDYIGHVSSQGLPPCLMAIILDSNGVWHQFCYFIHSCFPHCFGSPKSIE